MNTKICGTCGIEKDILNFYKNPVSKDKLFKMCKQCCKKRKKHWKYNPIKKKLASKRCYLKRKKDLIRWKKHLKYLYNYKKIHYPRPPKQYLKEIICLNCKIKFQPYFRRQKYCCHKCYVIKMGHGTNWKGGICHSNGYVYIKSPTHPFRTKSGYVAEHRLVMEKHIGRYLYKNEVVHHINFDKSDNRLKNLMLFNDRNAHNKYHKFVIKRSDEGYPLDENGFIINVEKYYAHFN